MKNKTIYFGDNLEILKKKTKDESFHLIYLDPPFKKLIDKHETIKRKLV